MNDNIPYTCACCEPRPPMVIHYDGTWRADTIAARLRAARSSVTS